METTTGVPVPETDAVESERSFGVAQEAPESPDPDRGEATPRSPVSAQADPAESGLTDQDRQVLAFEQRWWRHAGAKEQAIRDTFDISATRYYQILNRLLDNPAAMVVDPMLVGRLRRLRSTRARRRYAAPPTTG